FSAPKGKKLSVFPTHLEMRSERFKSSAPRITRTSSQLRGKFCTSFSTSRPKTTIFNEVSHSQGKNELIFGRKKTFESFHEKDLPTPLPLGKSSCHEEVHRSITGDGH